MTSTRVFYIGLVALAVAAVIAACAAQMTRAPTAIAEVRIDNDDIGGVVTSSKGPEAGVWVIAETHDLPTRFTKMVVTDDQGRYVVPDLPKANYSVWVRGYGLVDSPKVKAIPGNIVNLKAIVAPHEEAAAHYYPAIYWYSMMTIPDKDEFGGKGKIPANLSQKYYLNLMKSNGCANCHSLGLLAIRTFPRNLPFPLGKFANSEEAWLRRIQSGQAGEQMFSLMEKELGRSAVRYLADWTDRIAEGELPHTRPIRPQGVERNIVVTTWDWLNEKHYLHDLISSDRRDPTGNAYGRLYGSTEHSTDIMPILDQKTHKTSEFKMPVRDTDTPMAIGPGQAASDKVLKPSAYWDNELIWTSRANNHNGMFDRKGRVWLTAAIRGPNNPAFCKGGSDHPSAKTFPLERASRHLSMLDPKTMKYTFIDTCFNTHHLQFDANDILWTSAGGA